MSHIPIYCEYSKEANVDELKIHPESPYIHNEDQIIILSKIIENNGWRNNIVVSSRDSSTITKGRLLYETAIYNGWDKVPIEIQEYSSEEEEIADMVSDNKITSMSEMDDFILAEVIERISEIGGDIGNTGYNESMINTFLNSIDEDMVIGGEKEFEIQDEDSIKTIKLIYDKEDFELFKVLITDACEKENEVPSQLIYKLAFKAYKDED